MENSPSTPKRKPFVTPKVESKDSLRKITATVSVPNG